MLLLLFRQRKKTKENLFIFLYFIFYIFYLFFEKKINYYYLFYYLFSRTKLGVDNFDWRIEDCEYWRISHVICFEPSPCDGIVRNNHRVPGVFSTFELGALSRLCP